MLDSSQTRRRGGTMGAVARDGGREPVAGIACEGPFEDLEPIAG
jgi:hypothetical protein